MNRLNSPLSRRSVLAGTAGVIPLAAVSPASSQDKGQVVLATGGGMAIDVLRESIIKPFVPAVIFAIALYAVYAKLHLTGSIVGFAMAYFVLTLPYVVVTVSAGLKSTDASREAAALTLGAGPIRAFWNVTLSQLRPSIVSASFLAFLTSFDDGIMALFLSGLNAKTMPVRMWQGIRFEIDPIIAAVSVFLMGMTVLLKLVADLAAKWGVKSGLPGFTAMPTAEGAAR